MEKPEALTILRRNEFFWVNFRIPRHLVDQPESARNGQWHRFFQVYGINKIIQYFSDFIEINQYLA
jgi:hypothetical protein